LKCELSGRERTAPRETHREMPSSLRWRARTLTYVSAGCNRSVHAAAWNTERGPGGGLLAYGSHSSIALYDPATARVVRTVGKAHDGGQVTAVSWLDWSRR
jgi:elongator complex protein 2